MPRRTDARPTTCLRDLSRIPELNFDRLREKFPDHRPPLSPETIESWGVYLPTSLYDYLTQFSDTIYDSINNKTQITYSSIVGNLLRLDNSLHLPVFLDLSTGKIEEHFYYEDDEEYEEEEEEEDNEPDYMISIIANSFGEYIMKQFQPPLPNCQCRRCFETYARNYNILRIMSGMSGLSAADNTE